MVVHLEFTALLKEFTMKVSTNLKAGPTAVKYAVMLALIIV
jgi:hypothetical protein